MSYNNYLDQFPHKGFSNTTYFHGFANTNCSKIVKSCALTHLLKIKKTNLLSKLSSSGKGLQKFLEYRKKFTDDFQYL